MDLNKSYIKTDATLEKDGVEVELDDGAVIIVRPIRNADFKRYLNELQKPYERKIQQKRMDQEALDNLTRKAVAKHVLIGWKGIELDGKPVKYSPKVAEELMIEFDEFQDDVLSAATARETFREEIVEENEKNS
jgi:hypothetical protein